MDNVTNQQQQQNQHPAVQTGETVNQQNTGIEVTTGGVEGQDDEPIYTQAQVDAMIKNRVNRANKKVTALQAKLNQTQQQVPQVQQPVQQGNLVNQQATNQGGQQDINSIVLGVLQSLGIQQQPQVQQAQVQQPAKQPYKVYDKVIKATAKAEALALGVASENLEDVLALSNLRSIEVDDDGEFDELDIQNAIKGVLKKHPSFSKTLVKQAPLKGGVAGGQQQTVNKSPNDLRLERFSEAIFKNQQN